MNSASTMPSPSSPESTPPGSVTAREWDRVRAAFASSLLVDTPLSSLAQNLEGPAWPASDRTDTPARYIDLELAEVQALLDLAGHPPGRLAQLVAILQETLAFDEPFGDMVAQNEAAAARDNPVLRTLERLGIPADLPVGLTALSASTLEFCQRERITTLGELAVFSQQMAQSVIVGGDFRELLNALSQVDEVALARLLPFRPGTRGVHWLESVGQVFRSVTPEGRAVWGRGSGEQEAALASALNRRAEYFAAELAAWRAQPDLDLNRVVQELRKPVIEPFVLEELERRLDRRRSAPAARAGDGLLTRVGRWFGRGRATS